MKTNNFKLVLLAICLVAFTPLLSEASTAVRVSDTLAFFTIDFTIDDEQFDTEVPIGAKYGVTYNDRVDYLGFTIESDDTDATPIAEVNGLVLSEGAPISDSRYVAKAGTPTDFTLLIAVTFTEEPTTNEYRARITKLPYFLDGRRTTVHQNQLNDLTMPILEIE